MLLLTWRLQGTLLQRPHCMTVAALDRLLDKKMSEPQLLGQVRYARAVQRSIQRYDGDLYTLRAWVVVNNHAHLLIDPLAGAAVITRTVMDETENQSQLALWVREANEQAVLGNAPQVIQWIETHPVRAGLVAHADQWRWSSASIALPRKMTPIQRDLSKIDASIIAA